MNLFCHKNPGVSKFEAKKSGVKFSISFILKKLKSPYFETN
jgi:hypothetical protein